MVAVGATTRRVLLPTGRPRPAASRRDWRDYRSSRRAGSGGADGGLVPDRMIGAMATGDDITQLLQSWRSGSDQARDALFAATYEELRRLAAIQMRGERADHTLQPTALVNECYGRLVGVELDWQDRAHFLNFAVRSMRRLLVDHARARTRAKRGGPDAVRATLSDAVPDRELPLERLLELDDAFDKLADISERSARVVELQAYGGLSYREIAEVLEVSEATVDRELRFARAWLKDHLD